MVCVSCINYHDYAVLLHYRVALLCTDVWPSVAKTLHPLCLESWPLMKWGQRSLKRFSTLRGTMSNTWRTLLRYAISLYEVVVTSLPTCVCEMFLCNRLMNLIHYEICLIPPPHSIHNTGLCQEVPRVQQAVWQRKGGHHFLQHWSNLYLPERLSSRVGVQHQPRQNRGLPDRRGLCQ